MAQIGKESAIYRTVVIHVDIMVEAEELTPPQYFEEEISMDSEKSLDRLRDRVESEVHAGNFQVFAIGPRYDAAQEK